MPRPARPIRDSVAGQAGHAESAGSEPAQHRVRAYLGLGANLGDAEETLVAAVHALAAVPGVAVVRVSPLYATAPVGVTDQPDFLNAAMAIDAPAGSDQAAGAVELLVALKRIERAFGRRTRRRWGPRELDLDLLLYGDARLLVDQPPDGLPVDPAYVGPFLEVPHPSAPDRLFVLAPLADLAQDLVPPGWPETVGEARDRRIAAEGADAALAVAPWSDAAGRWEGRVRARRPASRTAPVRAVADAGGGEAAAGGSPVAADGSPVAVYVDLPGESDAALIHAAVVEAGLPAGCVVLELGCGAGRVTAALTALGHPVIAVDQSPEMIAEVKRRVPAATAVTSDIEALDLGGRRVPAVVLASHLVNVEAASRAAFLGACRRHVTADGCVLVQCYEPDRDWGAGVGRPTRSGPVTIILLRADRTGDVLTGSVAYETPRGRWVQDFTAILLDEAALRASLRRSSLAFERWVDARGGWFLARPS